MNTDTFERPDRQIHRKLNSSRERLWQENSKFANGLTPGARLLDAGAGKSLYRNLFKEQVYESADIQSDQPGYPELTYNCDLTEIPVEDGRFDAVLLNQVLEHVPNPEAVLRELFRVMKPGAKLLYTGPFFYQEHLQPWDFYRYTQFGLREQFGRAGFEVQSLDWLEGYFGTIAYQFEGMAQHIPTKLPKFAKAYRVRLTLSLVKFLASRGAPFFHKLELRHRYKKGGYPKNYRAIIVKPNAQESLP